MKAHRLPRDTSSIITVYTHEWDESRSLFRRLHTKASQRVKGYGVHEQILAQRGAWHTDLADGRGGRSAWREEWLATPRIVEGVSAEELWPGILLGLPEVYASDGGLRDLANSVDYAIFAPIGDKASSNIRILQVWGKKFQHNASADLQRKCLYLPDTCQAHSHHRGKLQVHALRHHTTRLFSITNLLRLPAVQGRAVSCLEKAIQSKLERKMQPPPRTSQRLYAFVDVLYDLEDARHNRKGGGKSVLHKDIMAFLEMFNGDLNAGRLVHYCAADAAQHCCANRDECLEKCTVAALNLLVGGDSIPCESRWTHTLPGMQRMLTRMVVEGLGMQRLFGDVVTGPPETACGADDAARADFYKELNGIRAHRAAEYFNNPKTKLELGVLVVALGVADRLLYSLLGGVDRQHPLGKVSALVQREAGLVAEVLGGFLHLLDGWDVGGDLRRPWCVLDILGAPVRDASFAQWSRSQILRLAAALHRRYETKYAAWPFALYKLCSDEWSAEEKRAMASSVCASPRCCLDAFAAGFRRAFPSPEAMLSPKAAQLLSATFDALRTTTDFCERQHAEVQANRTIRSGASRVGEHPQTDPSVPHAQRRPRPTGASACEGERGGLQGSVDAIVGPGCCSRGARAGWRAH